MRSFLHISLRTHESVQEFLEVEILDKSVYAVVIPIGIDEVDSVEKYQFTRFLIMYECLCPCIFMLSDFFLFFYSASMVGKKKKKVNYCKYHFLLFYCTVLK